MFIVSTNSCCILILSLWILQKNTDFRLFMFYNYACDLRIKISLEKINAYLSLSKSKSLFQARVVIWLLKASTLFLREPSALVLLVLLFLLLVMSLKQVAPLFAALVVVGAFFVVEKSKPSKLEERWERFFVESFLSLNVQPTRYWRPIRSYSAEVSINYVLGRFKRLPLL